MPPKSATCRSPLSVAVKKVEEELGIQLFERSLGVKITETGRHIVAKPNAC